MVETAGAWADERLVCEKHAKTTIILVMTFEKLKQLTFTTEQVAQLCGVEVGCLKSRARYGKFPFPPRNGKRGHQWSWEDVLRVEKQFQEQPVLWHNPNAGQKPRHHK